MRVTVVAQVGLLHIAATQRGGLLQLALDRPKRKIDERWQLRGHVMDHLRFFAARSWFGGKRTSTITL